MLLNRPVQIDIADGKGGGGGGSGEFWWRWQAPLLSSCGPGVQQIAEQTQAVIGSSLEVVRSSRFFRGSRGHSLPHWKIVGPY